MPTCRPDELLRDVRARVLEAGERICIVTNEQGIVFGRVRGEAWNAAPEAPVEEVMEPGPGTIRPDVFLPDIIPRMKNRGVGSILVTEYGSHLGGRLLGVLFRADGERMLAENEARPGPE